VSRPLFFDGSSLTRDAETENAGSCLIMFPGDKNLGS
jgi:hypothetical protein